MSLKNSESILSSNIPPPPTVNNPKDFKLNDNDRIAVIGGGPAGSLFSYFLLDMAERVGLSVQVDVYEPRDFHTKGPKGCNMCGGVISESLVQILAAEGIILPPSVIQKGIDSYVLHTDVGSVQIQTPLHEKRIGAVFRGAGPKGDEGKEWESFDGFLLKLAQKKGARVIQDKVEGVRLESGLPLITTRSRASEKYELLAVAAGINSSTLDVFEDLGTGYKPPGTTKTFICEYFLGEKTISDHLGHSMHTFLLNIPRLEFAALIPKGRYATMCILGRGIDKPLIQSFVSSSVVKSRFPVGWKFEQEVCRCFPGINIKGSEKPFADRILFIGDSGVSRLYKDGIGAAYRTSKAAARTAVFEDVSEKSFRRHFWPTCRAVERDNRIGKFIFSLVRMLQKQSFIKRGILRLLSREQKRKNHPQRMSMIMWDLFTGSAPYREVLMRFWHPIFLLGFIWNIISANWPLGDKKKRENL